MRSVWARMVAEGEASSVELRKQAMVQDAVWEYILMHSKSFEIVSLLAEELPMPNTTKVKKMVLVKLISLDFHNGALEERDLIALNSLEQFYGDECGDERLLPIIQQLQLLLRAELAIVHLRTDGWQDYCDALDKFWGESVQDTEEAANEEVEISKMRTTMKTDLWGVKSRPRMKEFVLGEYRREALEDLLKRFLAMAKLEIGPSFLEVAQEDFIQGRYTPGKRVRPAEVVDKNKRVRKTLLPSYGVEDADGSGQDRDKGKQASHDNHSGDNHSGDNHSGDNHSDGLRSPEVAVALRDLKRSQCTLREHVQDPLPGAIEVAKELKRLDATTPQDGNTGEEKNNSGKLSLMDRHPSAQTSQWVEDDEIENSPRGNSSPSASNQVRLPKSDVKPQQVSPLPKTQSGKPRRKKNRWTQLEEDTLREAVQAYGKGRWKIILENNRKVFENRNEVDLKDKWRNIERAEGVKR